jgi:hypothetical protein
MEEESAMWTDQPHTMQHVYQEICENELPWVALGNFMNDFFRNFEQQREELIVDPIREPEHPTAEQHQWAIFCVASVAYLCEKYALPVPGWITDERYAPLAEPWYMIPEPGLNIPSVRAQVVDETPEPFTQRNIFCGNRVWLDKREEAAKLRRLLKSA